MDTYKPEIIKVGLHEYITFALKLKRCPICDRVMMSKASGMFPEYYLMNQEAQMKAAGVVYVGAYRTGHDDYACEVCTQEGKITFRCALCGEERASDLLHETYHGEPLCEVCYTTKSAKEWEVTHDALDESHRYDYS